MLTLSFAVKAQPKGSQVVDDSTKSIYGPNTTRWTTEEDMFFNRKNYNPIDTSVINYHRWTYVQRFNNEYKDLGNIGTAFYPIFPSLEGSIGVSTGFSVYDQYFLTEEPNYFDTKSPYTRIRIIWGGKGRAMTDVEFSRNITPRWNFGFSYRPILIGKQLERAGKQDRQTVSHYYDTYMAYRTENDRYQVLFNYRRIKHAVVEMGGIDVVDSSFDSTYQSIFDSNNSPLLRAANTIQLQNQFHLFHQYRIGSGLQFYHKADIGRKINQFTEDLNTDPASYYDYRAASDSLSPNIINDSTRFSFFTNELGIKGKLGKLFYNGYAKARSYKFRYKYFTADTLALALTDNEYYLGGRLSFEYDSVTHFTSWLEYLDGGNYRAEVALQSKWLNAKAVQHLSKPPFIHNAYRGSFDLWNNDFRSTLVSQVEAFGQLTLGRLFLSPGFKYTSFSDYIYFKKDNYPGTSQKVLPLQSSGNQNLFSPELRADLRFLRNVHLKPQVIYSVFLTNDDDALRVPELFVNTQLAYEGQFFKRNLEVHMGFDINWKSEYFDYAYDVSSQQFYVQNDVASPSFPLVDVFLNGKMKRGRFFFKYNNIVQLFTNSGYLSTPVYPGQRNILDFGFELLLFD